MTLKRATVQAKYFEPSVLSIGKVVPGFDKPVPKGQINFQGVDSTSGGRRDSFASGAQTK